MDESKGRKLLHWFKNCQIQVISEFTRQSGRVRQGHWVEAVGSTDVRGNNYRNERHWSTRTGHLGGFVKFNFYPNWQWTNPTEVFPTATIVANIKVIQYPDTGAIIFQIRELEQPYPKPEALITITRYEHRIEHCEKIEIVPGLYVRKFPPLEINYEQSTFKKTCLFCGTVRDIDLNHKNLKDDQLKAEVEDCPHCPEFRAKQKSIAAAA